MIDIRKELRDQTAHCTVAFAAVALLEAIGTEVSPIGGLIVGLAMAAPREHAQHGWKLFRERLSGFDGLFWLAGGTLAAWLF